MIIDITQEMLEFKEATRHTWNTYFATSSEPISSETQDAFYSIECALLRVLVLAPHGVGETAELYRMAESPCILVTPLFEDIPIQMGYKEQNGNVIWDEPILMQLDENAQFRFFDFFDWNLYGRLDFPFVRARMVGRVDSTGEEQRVLIEQRYCKFSIVVNPEAQVIDSEV